MTNFDIARVLQILPHRYIQVFRRGIAFWLLSLSGLVFQSGLGTLILILVARKVEPFEYGQYLACFALASFLIVLPSFGIETWLLTQHKTGETAWTSLWVSVINTRIRLLLLWIILFTVLAFFLPAGTFPPSILIPTIFGAALDSLLMLSYSAQRSRNKHGFVSTIQITYSFALLGLTLILPIEEGSIWIFAVARSLLSLAFAIPVTALPIIRYLSNRSMLTPSQDILRASQPFFWAELSSSIYVKADFIIISLNIGPSGTSSYGPAINILQAAFLPLRSLFLVTVPILSRAYQTHLGKFLNRSSVQLISQILLGLSLSIFLWLFAFDIINLIYTDEYAAAGLVLRVLSPIPFIRSINFALAAILTSSGQQRNRTTVQIVAAIFNVSLNLWVVNAYGVIGVAIIYILSELILVSGYLLLTFGQMRRIRLTRQ